MKTKHTEFEVMTGPFKVIEQDSEHECENKEVYLADEQGFHLCMVYNKHGQFIEGSRQAQAEKIARAMNTHDELVELAQWTYDNVVMHYDKIGKLSELLKRAKGGAE